MFASMSITALGYSFITLYNNTIDPLVDQWTQIYPSDAVEYSDNQIDDQIDDVQANAQAILDREDWWYEDNDAESLLIQACGLFLAVTGEPTTNVGQRLVAYTAALREAAVQQVTTPLLYLIRLLSLCLEIDMGDVSAYQRGSAALGITPAMFRDLHDATEAMITSLQTRVQDNSVEARQVRSSAIRNFGQALNIIPTA